MQTGRYCLHFFPHELFYLSIIHYLNHKVTLGGLDTCLSGQLVPDGVIHSSTHGHIKMIRKS